MRVVKFINIISFFTVSKPFALLFQLDKIMHVNEKFIMYSLKVFFLLNISHLKILKRQHKIQVVVGDYETATPKIETAEDERQIFILYFILTYTDLYTDRQPLIWNNVR